MTVAVADPQAPHPAAPPVSPYRRELMRCWRQTLAAFPRDAEYFSDDRVSRIYERFLQRDGVAVWNLRAVFDAATARYSRFPSISELLGVYTDLVENNRVRLDPPEGYDRGGR